jgi:hypothetical protein
MARYGNPLATPLSKKMDNHFYRNSENEDTNQAKEAENPDEDMMQLKASVAQIAKTFMMVRSKLS